MRTLLSPYALRGGDFLKTCIFRNGTEELFKGSHDKIINRLPYKKEIKHAWAGNKKYVLLS